MKVRTIFLLLIGFSVLFSCKKEHQANQSPGPVTACFTIPKDTFYVGDTVTFTNCSINADTLLYSFGDGSTSSFKNPIHIYSQPGTYSVSLRASNLSLSNITSTSIIVKPGIPSNLPWRYFAPGSNTDSVVFYGTGAGIFMMRGYDFADGYLFFQSQLDQNSNFSLYYNGGGLTYNGSGVFSNHDSAVNIYCSFLYIPASGIPQSSTITFYGIRQ